jgi:hypothetical protein
VVSDLPPTPSPAPLAPGRPARFGWARLGIGLGLMAAVAAGILLLGDKPDAGATGAPTKAVAGRGYYLYLSEIEVEGTDTSGNSWDARGGAPDLAYEIRWRGATVFRSSTVSDALLARWSLAAIGLDNVSGGVSRESTVRAARIHVGEGEEVEISVVDSDVTFDDPVAKWTCKVASLGVGSTAVALPAGRVRRAVIVLRPFEDVNAGDLLK